jgi:hypothetical protein
MAVFKDIFIYPSYGDKQCILKWAVDSEFKDANVIIQKSPNGTTGWETIHSAVGLREYVDKDFIVPTKHQNTFYKVILQKNGKRYDSDSVAVFNKLKRREYGLLARMMQLEHHRMFNVGDGLEVIVAKPLLKGTTCACVDSETQQKLGATQCTKCFGNIYEGGYQEPVRTFLSIEQQKQTVAHDQAGLGTNDATEIQFRILAYPELRRNDLIIIPESDERYLVKNAEISKFKGVVPFIYLVNAEFLRRDDIRYKYKPDA